MEAAVRELKSKPQGRKLFDSFKDQENTLLQPEKEERPHIAVRQDRYLKPVAPVKNLEEVGKGRLLEGKGKQKKAAKNDSAIEKLSIKKKLATPSKKAVKKELTSTKKADLEDGKRKLNKEKKVDERKIKKKETKKLSKDKQGSENSLVARKEVGKKEK